MAGLAVHARPHRPPHRLCFPSCAHRALRAVSSAAPLIKGCTIRKVPTTLSDWRSARRQQRAAAESGDAVIQPRTPTVYDWPSQSEQDASARTVEQEKKEENEASAKANESN